jgi:malate dehydrogenase
VVLGAGGVEKIIELELSEEEKKAFEASTAHVKELVVKVEGLL